MFALPLYAKVDSTQVCHSCNQIQRDASIASLAPKWQTKTLKVIHMGDSHVQMGYFTGEIKRLLGARKTGMQFPYRLAKGVDGPLFKSKAKGNWEGTSILKSASGWNIGIAGYAASTRDSAAQIQFIAKDSLLRFQTIRVWFKADSCSMEPDLGTDFRLSQRVQEGNVGYWDFIGSGASRQFTLSLQKSTPQQDVFTLLGLEMLTDDIGIDYQDLGVSGAQFTHLKSRGNLALDQIGLLKPDLIICSFGTNESYNPNWNAEKYRRELLAFKEEVKMKSPASVFLFTSPPDTRSQHRVPKYQEDVIRVLAALPSPFYDLNQVMGGFGSSEAWVKNGCFLRDQLHLTKEGYQLQAKLFVLALLKTWGDEEAFSILQNQVNQHTVSIGIPK